MLEEIRKMEEPKNKIECHKIFKHFGLSLPDTLDIFENAKQLVKVNNDFVSLIDRYKGALRDAKDALDSQYNNQHNGVIQNNKAYMAIFNALEDK